MKAKMFEKALDVLGLKQVEFAKLFGINDRTVRLYASDGVTNVPTTILINLLLMRKIKIKDIEIAKAYD